MKKRFLYSLITLFFFTFSFNSLVYAANCPLGYDVTRDLQGVMRVIRIVVPILVVVLSIFDAVVALTKGNEENEIKKVAKKFGKRMVYAVILGSITTIVPLVLSITGIVEVSNCDLKNPSEVDNEIVTKPRPVNPYQNVTSEECKNRGEYYDDGRCIVINSSSQCTYFKNSLSCANSYDNYKIYCKWDNDSGICNAATESDNNNFIVNNNDLITSISDVTNSRVFECSTYKETECNSNLDACVWDSDIGSCYARNQSVPKENRNDFCNAIGKNNNSLGSCLSFVHVCEYNAASRKCHAKGQ